jgi:muconolactone delta-isomerase
MSTSRKSSQLTPRSSLLVAQRASRTRAFEAVLNDSARFAYFLDYLSGYGQSHKLLFIFEVEQLKAESASESRGLGRKESTFKKFWDAGGEAARLSLGLPPEVAALTAALYNANPASCMAFGIAQAFVHQELMERWFALFQESASYQALKDHLCMSYPLSLPQLLVEGPLNALLLRFLAQPKECPPSLAATYHLYHTILTVSYLLFCTVFVYNVGLLT